MSKQQALANKLLAIVNKLGMQRIDVAEYLGVSERTLYRWMSGDAAFPRMVFIALSVLIDKRK